RPAKRKTAVRLSSHGRDRMRATMNPIASSPPQPSPRAWAFLPGLTGEPGSGLPAALELGENPPSVRMGEDPLVQHLALHLAGEARILDGVPVHQRRPHRVDDLGARY